MNNVKTFVLMAGLLGLFLLAGQLLGRLAGAPGSPWSSAARSTS